MRVIGQREKEIEALVDTGSFITGVDEGTCKEAGLRFTGLRRIQGLYYARYLPMFRGVIEVQEKTFQVDIAGLHMKGAILGRDILKNFKMTLDWLKKTAHMEDPTKRNTI